MRWDVMAAMVVALVGAACAGDDGDPPESFVGCGLPCDDGDPCTDDRCDPSSGTCTFLPRDARLACRNDGHCEDGEACTIDSCAVDECGLQRCTVRLADGCTGCLVDKECRDELGCTLDTCRFPSGPAARGGDIDVVSGFCVHEDVDGCDPHCDGLGDASEQTFIMGTVAPGAPSCTDGCPCASPPTLTRSEDGARYTLALDDATCTTTRCAPDVAWSCTPLVAGPTYLVYGDATDAVTGGGLAVGGWCMLSEQFFNVGTYAGELTIAGRGRTRFEATFREGTQLELAAAPCDDCGGDLEITVQQADFAPQEGHAYELRLVVRDQDFFRFLTARLHATPTGAAGVHRADDNMAAGTLRLDWIDTSVE